MHVSIHDGGLINLETHFNHPTLDALGPLKNSPKEQHKTKPKSTNTIRFQTIFCAGETQFIFLKSGHVLCSHPYICLFFLVDVQLLAWENTTLVLKQHNCSSKPTCFAHWSPILVRKHQKMDRLPTLIWILNVLLVRFMWLIISWIHLSYCLRSTWVCLGFSSAVETQHFLASTIVIPLFQQQHLIFVAKIPHMFFGSKNKSVHIPRTKKSMIIDLIYPGVLQPGPRSPRSCDAATKPHQF